MHSFSLKSTKPRHNQSKSDIFSIGMTLLECCTLYNSASYYDFNSCKIDFITIFEMINRSRKTYS